MSAQYGWWAKSGKSQAHYVPGFGFRGEPSLCGTKPNNGRWDSHPGLRDACLKCVRLAALRNLPSSETVASPVRNVEVLRG